jgi:ribosomal peptide maturation radical SAM protein 1
VDVLHGHLDYADWVVEQTDFTFEDYQFYALDSYFLGCGDWVFTSALWNDSDSRVRRFERCMADKVDENRLARIQTLRRLSRAFIDDLADRILTAGPDVVGFTSTFQQNIAVLAVARALKDRAPEIVCVMGGANCDGVQGQALHRNFSCLDFVVRGEGEVSFPQLLRALNDGGELGAVAGLCHRDENGTTVANPMSVRPLSPDQIVTPDFDGYRERLAVSVARRWVEPKLVVEGARGCWWGEKHHCTFCGLNGSFMEFRSKSPRRLFDEIVWLAGRYQMLDFFVVDNILDMHYVRTLLPRLAEAGYDLRFQVEIKSNMRRDQIRVLREAGLVSVQPGIENLSSRVLTLMDKGVSGCQNVRLLRDAQSEGLTVLWNYLYGFPGEIDEDYISMIKQFAALHHLAPPNGTARIQIERFSPYFDRPDLGFAEVRPAQQYMLNYDLPEDELKDLAYIFDAALRGIGSGAVAALEAGLTEWERAYPHSRLVYWDFGERIVLAGDDRRFDWPTWTLTDAVEVAVFRLLDQPRTVGSIVRQLPDSTAETVSVLLESWCSAGLVFTDAGQYVHLACEATNTDLLRIRNTATTAAHTTTVTPTDMDSARVDTHAAQVVR